MAIIPCYAPAPRAPLKRENPDPFPLPSKRAIIETLATTAIAKTSTIDEKVQDWKERFTTTTETYYSSSTNYDKHKRTMTLFQEFKKELSLIKADHLSPLLSQYHDLVSAEDNNFQIHQEIFKKDPSCIIPAHPRHTEFQDTILTPCISQKKLGEGSFGVVIQKCYSRDLKVAIKSPLKVDDEAKTLARKEAIFGTLLKHPNITYFLGINNFDLAFELAKESLFSYIEKSKISNAGLKAILKDITHALEYLRGLGIIHRDLKPDNVLVFPGNLCKVADFGLACTTADIHKTQAGTDYYMAPEVFNDKFGEKNCSIDLWSLGVVLFDILQKNKKEFIEELTKHFKLSTEISTASLTKFFTKTNNKILESKIQEVLKSCFPNLRNPKSVELLNLMTALLRVNSHDRISADRVLERLDEIE